MSEKPDVPKNPKRVDGAKIAKQIKKARKKSEAFKRWAGVNNDLEKM